MMLSITAFAESDGTTITINSGVKLPVTVKPNGGQAFTINQRSYTTSTRIADAVFHDGNGNRCHYDHRTAHVGGNVHHYYTVTKAYPSSNSSDSSSDNSSSTSNSSSGLSIANTMIDWGHNWVYMECEGHPYLALGIGLSKSCGEFVRLKWTHGGDFGLVLSGAVGKDWAFKEEYADKLCWNVGAGVRYSNEHNEFEWNLLVGRTPWHPDCAIMMNLEYAHYFGDSKRFGVFGNIGFAGTNLSHDKDDKAKAYFDFSVGVAVKLWQH